jgi:hypothetical protein
MAFPFNVKKLFLFLNNLKRGEHVNGQQFYMNAGLSEILVFLHGIQAVLYSYS